MQCKTQLELKIERIVSILLTSKLAMSYAIFYDLTTKKLHSYYIHRAPHLISGKHFLLEDTLAFKDTIRLLVGKLSTKLKYQKSSVTLNK